MPASIHLRSEELRIIGHAINWLLNVPYERTSPPELAEHELDFLNSLLSDLCDMNRLIVSGPESGLLEIGEPYSCSGGKIRVPAANFRLLVEAVASFFGELEFSPTEIEMVTGSPLFKTADLSSRLQALYQSWGGAPPQAGFIPASKK